MKPKRKLRSWVKVALLLLPEVVIAGLLFFILINLNRVNTEVIIEVHNHKTGEIMEVVYE